MGEPISKLASYSHSNSPVSGDSQLGGDSQSAAVEAVTFELSGHTPWRNYHRGCGHKVAASSPYGYS